MPRRISAVCLLGFTLIAGCAQERARATNPASATPSPIRTFRPRQTATPARTLAPSATPGPATPMPSPTATPVRIVRLPPEAPPRILAMHLSRDVVSGGDTLRGTIETSSNVASVEARIGTYGVSFQKVGIGQFAIKLVVPNVPFFLHQTYTMQVIAHNSAGATTTQALPITVR